MSSVRTLFKTGCRGVLATGGCKCFTNVMTQTYSTATGKHIWQSTPAGPTSRMCTAPNFCAMQQQCPCSQSGRTDSQAALIIVKKARTDVALVLPIYAEHAVAPVAGGCREEERQSTQRSGLRLPLRLRAGPHIERDYQHSQSHIDTFHFAAQMGFMMTRRAVP